MTQPPGPGLFSFALDTPKIIRHRLEYMENLHKKYGEVVSLPFGTRTSYILFHPDDFKHVLIANSKNYWKGRTFEKASRYLGKGLATIEGKEWITQRRRLNPHFHQDALKGLTQLMTDKINMTLDRWEAESKSGKTIELTTEFQRLAMEVVARALFGAAVPEEQIASIIDDFKYALIFTTNRTLNPFDIPESFPIPSNIKFRGAIDRIHKIVGSMIDTERKTSEPSKTLLGMLVHGKDPETGEHMGDQQILDEVMTMFLGGTDTSGNTMSWTLYHLGFHKDVGEKAKTLAREVLGSRTPIIEDLPKLEFLKRVIEETLRLRTQNYIMSRDSYEDDEIRGFKIKGKSTVFLGVYIAHRRADFWNNALNFEPDRFLPTHLKDRHPTSYIPFGAGPRKCIGFNFAFMEMTYAVAMILARFDLEYIDIEKVVPKPTWSLWPHPGIPVRVHRR